jgi:hypothetical protein
MLIQSDKRPRRAVTKTLNRFQCTELPPARGRVNAGSARPAGIPLRPDSTDTVNSLNHEGGDAAGSFLHDPEDHLVPDARANLRPSDMVTRRLSEMLYPTSSVVDLLPLLCGETRREDQSQDSAPSTEETGRHLRPSLHV